MSSKSLADDHYTEPYKEENSLFERKGCFLGMVGPLLGHHLMLKTLLYVRYNCLLTN